MSTKRKKSSGAAAEPAAPQPASKPKNKSAEPEASDPKSTAEFTRKKAAGAPAAKKAAKKSTASKSAAKKKGAVAKIPETAAARKSVSRSRKSAGKPEAKETLESISAFAGPVADPIGDVTDGEAHRSLDATAEPAAPAMMEPNRAGATANAGNGLPEAEASARTGKPRKRARTKAPQPAQEPAAEPPADVPEPEAELELTEARQEEPAGLHPEPRPEPQLERLQKILSQAGIASRRHAEEMIVAGRVMVNGQVVSQLGAKADPARDHIRVDGKLIQAEVRHRTFMLNKPKGYVTTVSDPEGRPTVMQFFEKVHERLYPVGRLDYQSEGLLLMTNDGELANLLTRAASGVEKTYVVKVAGQPGPEAIEQVRGGVRIDREHPGSGRVRTAPAQVRQIRPGDNPWYEVVLTEGRNRELRKMFHAVGHFVEKIRRVGYGPLVLDVEPGHARELTADEVNALRLTAEGKLKPKRPRTSAMLPKEAGRPAEEWQERRGRGARPQRGSGQREERPLRPRSQRPGQEHGGAPGGFSGRGPRQFEDRRLGDRAPSGPPRGGFDRRGPARFSGPRPERPPRDDRFGRGRPFNDRREQGFGKGQQDSGVRERGSGFGGRPRFERPPRESGGSFRPERPRGERREFRGEERPPRREFRAREDGAPRFERPNRFGGEQRRGWKRQEGPPQQAGPRREGPPRFQGNRERAPGGQRGAEGERRSGGKSSPGGERRPGNGPRPGGFRRGGPPRRGRG
jgi:23S rRNA pseudouridine2605 synthase